MTPKLNSPSVASMPVEEAGYRKPELTLSLGDYNVNGASMGLGRDGATFAFTIWPLSDAAVAVLEAVAKKHGRISIDGCRVPLLFDLVVVERKEPHRLRIIGRIVGAISDAMRNAR